MSWSTRELAELAGTTISTIRYYHRAGLLDEPERQPNGFKKYEAAHFTRILQLRRLRDLGIPLEELKSDAGEIDTAERLRRLDAELAEGIARMERARADVGVMLDSTRPLHAPPGLEDVDADLSDPDRTLSWIIGATYDRDRVADVERMVEIEPVDISRDYQALNDATPDQERQDLAERMAALFAEHARRFPWMRGSDEPLDAPRLAMMQAVADLYSDAQRDVLRRALILARGATAE